VVLKLRHRALADGEPEAIRNLVASAVDGLTPDRVVLVDAAGRLPLLMLGPIVTAYEHAMTDGEGRNTWRTDRYSPCPRTEAAGYLRFLASIGYPLSGIEQAVADLTPYTGDTPAGDPITGGPDQPGPDGPDHGPDGPGDGPEGPGDGPDQSGTEPDIADEPDAGDGDVPADSTDPGEEPADGQAAA